MKPEVVLSVFRFLRPTGTRSVAAAVAFLSATALASAGSLGFNFVDNGDGGHQDAAADSLGASEVAGAPGYQQASWNNLGRWGDTVGSMVDNSGAMSGVTLTWDSNNTWRNGAGTNTPDSKLMNGYLDATGDPNVDGPPYSGFDNANKPDVGVVGISAWLQAQGASSYDVVVYTDGDRTEGRIGEYWLQDFTYNNPPGNDFGNLTLGSMLTPGVFVSDQDNFSGTFTQVPLSADSEANAAAGNFIVFTGLTGDSFLLRTEEISSPSQLRAQINGFQIIAVPEPSAIALLGLAAVGGMMMRRRRA